MNRITSNLTVSDAPRVRNLPEKHPYDLVMSLGYFDEMGYSQPAASDTGGAYVFPDGDHEYYMFERAADTVLEGLTNDNDVLVHCQAGCSRSPAVCIAVLAVLEGRTYEDAYEVVKSAHEKTNLTSELEASARRYIEENA